MVRIYLPLQIKLPVMKIRRLFGLGIVASLFVTSCSTSKMAQHVSLEDDVYNSNVKAKQYEPVSKTRNDSLYANNYAGSARGYDTDYPLPADRYYYESFYRNYYTPYYDYYLNRGYDPYWGFGYGLSNFYGNVFYNPYRYWLYYGGSFWNSWNPYSYWYPYYNATYYDAGHKNNAIIRNNAPRPVRGIENGISTGGVRYLNDANSGLSERKNEYDNTRSTRGSLIDNSKYGRPSRGGEVFGRPDYNQNNPRTDQIPSKQAEPTYSPPRSHNGESSKSTGSNGEGRPARGGRG